MAALKSILFICIVAVLSFVLLIGQADAAGGKVRGDKGQGTVHQFQLDAELFGIR